jgi:hypothetical protein
MRILWKQLGREYGAFGYVAQMACGIVAHEQLAMLKKLTLRW